MSEDVENLPYQLGVPRVTVATDAGISNFTVLFPDIDSMGWPVQVAVGPFCCSIPGFKSAERQQCR